MGSSATRSTRHARMPPSAVHDFKGDQTYSEKPGHNFDRWQPRLGPGVARPSRLDRAVPGGVQPKIEG